MRESRRGAAWHRPRPVDGEPGELKHGGADSGGTDPPHRPAVRPLRRCRYAAQDGGGSVVVREQPYGQVQHQVGRGGGSASCRGSPAFAHLRGRLVGNIPGRPGVNPLDLRLCREMIGACPSWSSPPSQCARPSSSPCKSSPRRAVGATTRWWGATLLSGAAGGRPTRGSRPTSTRSCAPATRTRRVTRAGCHAPRCGGSMTRHTWAASQSGTGSRRPCARSAATSDTTYAARRGGKGTRPRWVAESTPPE